MTQKTSTPARTPKAVPPPSERPRWPFGSTVKMYAHACGKWCCRVKGDKRYFGSWDDPDLALAEWKREHRALEMGLDRPDQYLAVRPTVYELCNRWLDVQVERVKHGDLSPATYRFYCQSCRWLIRRVGMDKCADDMGPHDFRQLIYACANKSPAFRDRNVTCTRILFKWAHKNLGVDPPNYGTDFKVTPKRTRKMHKHNAVRRVWSPFDIQRLLDAATPQMRAILLLGLNGGFETSQLAELPTERVDLVKGRIDWLRPKTGEARCVPLWPETIAAIRAVVVPGQSLMFLNEKGRPLLSEETRYGTDTLRQRMPGLRKRARCPRDADGNPRPGPWAPIPGSMRWARTTFATSASRVRDDTARKLIMGHVIDSVHEGYIQDRPWEALETMVAHVRADLLGVGMYE